MRNREFLENILYDLWENSFCDIPRQNLVIIKYGKYSKRQLGSIKLANRNTKIKGLLKKKEKEYKIQDDKRVTVITVSRYFQNEVVPEFVVRAVIAHELCHYAHGFSSPLQKKFSKPHQGSIVKKELIKRELFEEQKKADKWFKDNWVNVVMSISK